MVVYARLVSRLAPHAWLINFTNPVSVVTQAVHQESDARVVGICDTPFEICEDAAHALGLRPRECAYDYFGLNHLGWLREVYHDGEPQLHRLWDDDRASRPRTAIRCLKSSDCERCVCCRLNISTTTTVPRWRSNIFGVPARAVALSSPS